MRRFIIIKREAVKQAMLRKDAGYVPWQVDFTGAYQDIYKQTNNGDLDVILENHITLARYKKLMPIEGSRLELDFFGMKWDRSAEDGGDIGLPVDPPLADLDADDSPYTNGCFGLYRFPQPNEAFAMEQVRILEENDREQFRLFGATFTLYERAWGLRGMENLLADMVMHPSFVHALMQSILEHHLKLLDLVLKHDFDGVLFGDDWGTQNGLVMGAAHWREFIKPYMRILCDKVKGSGKLVVLHCCGNIGEIIGEVIDIGVDCYNTVQPELYDLKKLKENYGGDLCFYGGISNQTFLPHATPDEVERKCLETMGILARGGGYILSPTHNLTPDIPLENAFAIVRAAKRFGL